MQLLFKCTWRLFANTRPHAPPTDGGENYIKVKKRSERARSAQLVSLGAARERQDFRKNAQPPLPGDRPGCKAVRIVQLFAVMLGKMKILQLQAGQRNSVLCLCQWSLLIPYTGSVWISKKAKNGPRFQTSQKKTFI